MSEVIFCPNCKSDKVEVARDMKATRHCDMCGYSWLPLQSKEVELQEKLQASESARVELQRENTFQASQLTTVRGQRDDVLKMNDELETRCRELEADRDRWKKHFDAREGLDKYVISELHKAETEVEQLQLATRVLEVKLEKAVHLHDAELRTSMESLYMSKQMQDEQFDFFKKIYDEQLSSITTETLEKGEI